MKKASRAAAIIALVALVSSLSVGARLKAAPTDSPEQVVRNLYAAFERGDMAALERLIAPDATWTYYGPPSVLPFGGTRRGPEGVADFFAKVDETLADPVAGQREFLVDGDTVVVPGFEESTVKATGIRYHADNVHIFKIRDGKIVRFEEFIDSGKVLLAFQGDVAAGKDKAAARDGAVDTSVGKAVFTTCVGCHGNDGQGRAMMYAPNLTGLDSAYLTRQLHNFREGRRGKLDDAHGFQMVGRATAIGDTANIAAVVQYIGRLASAPVADVKNRQMPTDLADQIATCATCHGDVGQGIAQLGAPALNTLDVRYIALQLANFRNGLRGYDEQDPEGQLMAASARTVPEKDIGRIAEYYGR